MKSFLMKFVFRINKCINFLFVGAIEPSEHSVITSGLATVASFCSCLLWSKKCGCGVRRV